MSKILHRVTRAVLTGGTARTQRAAGRSAFTLIEVLVVIAVIALLISLLLPSLRKSRLSGWLVVSMSNERSIGQAGAMYQTDQKGYLPIVPTGVPVPAPITAWITWGAWGKYSGSFWVPGVVFDIPPNKRPLNPYLFSGVLPGPNDANLQRGGFQLPGFRDPSDKIGHQQTWDAYQPSFGIASENSDHTNCYDDVGTSYLLEVKWFFQTTRYIGNVPDQWTKAWNFGTQRIKAGDSFLGSRFIWVNDEYCDITINQHSDTAQVKNGYGDINKSVVTFLDGHTKYIGIIPGGEGDPRSATQPWLVPAYCNSDYTVVFPDLR